MLQEINEEENAVEKNLLISDLIRYYLQNDSLEQAIAYLESMNTTAAKKLLVPTYLMQKDYANCHQRLDEIPADTDEDFQFHKLFDMLLAFCEQGNEIEDLGGEERQIVEEVAITETQVSVHAEAILAQIDSFQYYRIPEEIEDTSGTGKRANQVEADSKSLMITSHKNVLKIYPNPASNVIKIELPYIESNVEFEFILYNLIGEESGNYAINSEKRFIMINTVDLPEGLYIYKLIIDNHTIDTGKLSLIK